MKKILFIILFLLLLPVLCSADRYIVNPVTGKLDNAGNFKLDSGALVPVGDKPINATGGMTVTGSIITTEGILYYGLYPPDEEQFTAPDWMLPHTWVNINSYSDRHAQISQGYFYRSITDGGGASYAQVVSDNGLKVLKTYAPVGNESSRYAGMYIGNGQGAGGVPSHNNNYVITPVDNVLPLNSSAPLVIEAKINFPALASAPFSDRCAFAITSPNASHENFYNGVQLYIIYDVQGAKLAFLRYTAGSGGTLIKFAAGA